MAVDYPDPEAEAGFPGRIRSDPDAEPSTEDDTDVLSDDEGDD